VRDILLHGSTDEAFDRSVAFAARLARSFEARLHVVYTVADPLSAGWTSEVSAERMPEVHQAMEAEARERLARLIPLEEQAQLGVEIVLRTGPPAKELLAYANEQPVDLVIVQARSDNESDVARELVDHARSAVLVLR
jgi:nucleotide-binding universal stress UspA family protein